MEYPMSADRARAPAEFRALDVCHQQIAEHLARFERLLKMLEADGVTPEAQQLALTIEQFFSSTAQQHHAEEETRIFPPLLTSDDAALVAAVERLQQDHGFIEENLIELAPQLRALAAGYSWYDLATLQQGGQVFIELLLDHIELEESLIYPKAKDLWAGITAQSLRPPADAAPTAA
jgi:hemerythrin-like domain-containing protein